MRETKENIKKMEKRKNKILKSMLISDKMNPIKMASKDDLAECDNVDHDDEPK